MGKILSQKSYDSIKVINDAEIRERIEELKIAGEFGFALLLRWNQIEAAIKIIRYFERIKDGWPDELNFLGTTWKVLQDARNEDIENFQLMLGPSTKSLWKIRNLITHTNYNFETIGDCKDYFLASNWLFNRLEKSVPNLERLREKKRRSDAQLSARIG
ncbi:MAG: hypothetical protein HYZ65_12000 [Burkholderiales bacterium]|nr:hypothetical protein [Burkholderiales bacterium]